MLDVIEVDDQRLAKTEQREVLEDLVAESTRAHNQYLGRRNRSLVPPMDQAKAMEAIFVEIVVSNAHGLVLGGGHPAVISGCKRRMSPGLTAASASDCESWIWRPEFL